MCFEDLVTSQTRYGNAWARRPITGVRMALGDYLLKLEKPGYETEERTVWKAIPPVRLEPQGSRPRGMVRVDNSLGGRKIFGLRTVDLGKLPPIYLDRYEVTNQQFKQFVDQGGYQEQAFWEHPFVKDGKPLSWNEAMTEFRDATGRPGPAAWERGSYPDGQDEHPVRGVSWYEAAAYARFAGKALPTVYHWLAASGTGTDLARLHRAGEQFWRGRAGEGRAVPVGRTVRHLRHGRQRQGVVLQQRRRRQALHPGRSLRRTRIYVFNYRCSVVVPSSPELRVPLRAVSAGPGACRDSLSGRETVGTRRSQGEAPVRCGVRVRQASLRVRQPARL